MSEVLFRDKLGKELFINSTGYYNKEVVQLGISVYEDTRLNLNTRFYDFLSKKDDHLNLGCIHFRTREDVIFNLSDIDSYFEAKLSKWKKTNMFDLANERGELNKYHLVIERTGNREISVVPYKLSEYSLRIPYRLIGERYAHIDLDDNDFSKTKTIANFGVCTVCEGVYSFSEEDISLIKQELKSFIQSFYIL